MGTPTTFHESSSAHALNFYEKISHVATGHTPLPDCFVGSLIGKGVHTRRTLPKGASSRLAALVVLTIETGQEGMLNPAYLQE